MVEFPGGRFNAEIAQARIIWPATVALVAHYVNRRTGEKTIETTRANRQNATELIWVAGPRRSR